MDIKYLYVSITVLRIAGGDFCEKRKYALA